MVAPPVRARAHSFLFLLLLAGVAVSWGQAALSDFARWRDCASLLGASCPALGRPFWLLLAALLALFLAVQQWLRSCHLAAAFHFLVLAGLLSSDEGVWNSGWVTLRLHLFLALLPVTLYALHGAWLRGVDAPLVHLRPLIVASVLAMGVAPLGPAWARAGAWLVVAVGAVALLRLWAAAYHARPARSQPRLRLAALATALLAAPFILLTLLPELSRLPYHAPFEITLALLALGLAGTLLLTEPRVGFRLPAWVATLLNGLLLAIAALALYTLLGLLLSVMRTIGTTALLLVLSGLALAMIAQYAPRLTEWLLYAEARDYSTLLNRFISDFSATPARATVERFLTEELPLALGVTEVALYLHALERPTFVAQGGRWPSLAADGELVRLLRSVGFPVEGHDVRRLATDVSLTTEEQALVDASRFPYWLPFQSQERLHGFLLVGQRRGGDAFPPGVLRLLDTLRQPVALTLHTIYLLERLALSREEIRQTHQSSLAHVERERFTLAQELHDGPLQALLAMIHSLDLAIPAAQSERDALLGVVRQLRVVIRAVRPVGLHDLGLGEALGALVAEEAPAGGSLIVELRIAALLPTLSDEAALTLYRVAQEGLRNIQRHAAARYALIALRPDGDGVTLTVQDDGRGFVPPAHLTELALENHFGLAGMAERLRWAGGHLAVHSAPGQGAELRAWVPGNSEPLER